eukprot:3289405-Pleurochrysis_carterae.AAC.1
MPASGELRSMSMHGAVRTAVFDAWIAPARLTTAQIIFLNLSQCYLLLCFFCEMLLLLYSDCGSHEGSSITDSGCVSP